MKGWMRQKYVYWPGFKSAGVSQVTRPALGGPAAPSWPESNCTPPSARGYATPVSLLHGARHEVIECQMPLPFGASLFVNVIDCPAFTLGIWRLPVASPIPYKKLSIPTAEVSMGEKRPALGNVTFWPPWWLFSGR